jgi:putative redox protein
MANFTSIYKGQLRTEATHLASGTTIFTDAPVDNHGRGEAFSPTDLVCAALASCMMTIMGILADREGIDLVGTTMDITKTMSASPRKIAQIEVVMNISNKNLTDDQKLKLERAAHTCPVSLSLHPDVVQKMVFIY